MKTRTWYLAAFALGVVACASTKSTVVDAKPFTQVTELAKPSATVFDTLVGVINASNMRMSTVSKDSGVLEVTPKTMSAAEMDRYCEFPAVAKDGKPALTFVEYEKQRAGKSGGTGTVALDFLVKPRDANSCSLNMTANWSTTYEDKTVPCKSKGVFEGQIVDKLNSALLTPSK